MVTRRLPLQREVAQMRKLSALLLFFSLVAAAAAGMFELPEGEWESREPAKEYYRLEIGSAADKTLKLTFVAPTRDLRSTTWSGTYKVLAAKADPHFQWKISEVKSMGRDYIGRPRLPGKGEVIGGLLQSGEGSEVTLTLFDEEAQPIFTRKFNR